MATALAKTIRRKPLGAITPGYRMARDVEQMLDRILPPDAHEVARGKLHVSLTDVKTKENVIMSEFDSRQELIEVCTLSLSFTSNCLSFSRYIFVSLSLCPHVSLSLPISCSFFLRFSHSPYISLFLCLFFLMSLSLSPYPSLGVSFCCFLILPIYLCFCLFDRMSLSPSQSFVVSFFHFLTAFFVFVLFQLSQN